MKRAKKCRICDSPIEEGESFTPYKNGYAHTKCFEVETKTLLETKITALNQKNKGKRKTTPKAELKESLSEEDYKDKKQYYNYLKKLKEDGELTPKIYALSEGYIKKYGVSWTDLYNTLVYMNEILRKELEGDIVGIIPFFISEAKEYYKDLERIAKNAEDKIKTGGLYPVKTIQIKPYKRKVKQIDMTSV